jgi:tRNA 2-thiouridine synthesizing protein E
MTESLHEAKGEKSAGHGEFPHAPRGWTREAAEAQAREEELDLQADHWQAIRALQEYYARHEPKHINPRQLHDALDEHFHRQGGIRYLYKMFPCGPVAQGCRIAGLSPPAGAVDKGFGSVV